MGINATSKDLIKAKRKLRKNGVNTDGYYVMGRMPPDWEVHMMQIDKAIKLFKKEEAAHNEPD